MAQSNRLLTSCREPAIGRDKLNTVPQPSPENTESKDEHIIVACRNQVSAFKVISAPLYYIIYCIINNVNLFYFFQFYCVAVKAADRGRLTEQELTAQILAVVNEAPSHRTTFPIGILTAASRDMWAKARDIICHGNIITSFWSHVIMLQL